MSASSTDLPVTRRQKLIAWGCVFLQLIPPLSGLILAAPAIAREQHSLQTASVGKNPFEQQLASGAMSVGTTLSDEDRTSSEALSDYARSQAGSAVNSTVEGWLSQFGTVRSQISLDKDFSLSDGSLDMLLPLYDSPKNMLFTQLGGRRKDDRTTLNVGLGMRFFPSETWMLGANTFFDNDITGNNTRLGLGGELWADYLKVSANTYQRLSSWHTSRDMADYDERPANGFDMQINGFLPVYPQLGGKLVYEQYYGKEVALFGKDDRQKDPYAVTVGVNYTPVPMLSLGAEQKMGKSGKDDFSLNMAVTYQLDRSWSENASPEAVDAMRKLARSRYDLVERNNNIILEYRKNQAIKLHLAPEKLQGESRSLQTLTAQVNSKHGLKNITWSGGSYQQLGGTITALDATHYKLELPAWQVAQLAQAAAKKTNKTQASQASRILNTYVLTAVAEDIKGNKSAPSQLTVEVLPPQAHFGSDATISGDNAVPDGVTAVNVVYHIVDGNKKPLPGESVTFVITLADGSKTTREVISDKNGDAAVDVISNVAGEATVEAQLSSGDRSNVTVHFTAAEPDAAHSSLTASPATIAANGKAAALLTLVLHDSQDRPITGRTDIALKVTGIEGTTLSAVKETSPGNYTVAMSGTITGNAVINALFNGKNLSDITANVVLTSDEESAQIKAGNLIVVKDNVIADGKSEASVQVTVTDASDNPLSNQKVTFTATPEGIVTQSAVTNEQGQVTVPVTSKKAGAMTISAAVNDSSQSVQLNFIADNSTAQGVLSVTTNNAVADGKAINSIQLLMQDAGGNPIAGSSVTFSADEGATVLATSGVTDKDGKLSTTLTSTLAGAIKVKAKLASGEVLSIDVTFTADSSTATIAAGNLIVVTDKARANGSALNQVQVKVTDAQDNPLPAQAVSFSADNGASIEASAVTDNQGQVTVGLSSLKAGDSLVSASINGHQQTVKTTFIADESTAKGTLNVTADSAIADGKATNSVQLTVQDAGGNPVSGVSVTFSAGKGATVTTSTGVTDKDGKVSTTLTSTLAGISTVTAKLTSGETLNADVTFIADSSTAQIAAGDLSVVTNNAVANGSARNQVQVKVTDAQGNPLSAQQVSFSADNGAMIAASATTDSRGQVTIGLSSRKAGDSEVGATINGHRQVVTTTFIADKSTAQGTLSVSANGALANGEATNSVLLLMQDAGSNPVAGISITFSATNGAKVITASGVTDKDGKLSTAVTSTTAGSSKITSKSASGETLTADISFAADNSTARIAQGDITVVTDNAVANGFAQNQVQVKVTDAQGNPLSGQSVSFSATHAATITASAMTDSHGLLTVGLSSLKAGTSTVQATVGGNSQSVDTIFTADKSTAQGTLSVTDDGAVANGNDTNSVQATITDAHGNPLENITVNFSANNGAIVTPASATTNAEGIAVATLTSTLAGKTTVTGAATGISNTAAATFVADTSTAQIASGAMTVVANHAATDGHSANRVRVIVTDANGNKLSGQNVSFTADNHANIPATGTTNANGEVIVSLTSTTAGASLVKATINGNSESVTVNFEADGNTAQIADGALVMVKNGATANGSDTNSVHALVTDAGGNPVTGISVSFSATHGASITASGTTDSNGEVTATLTNTTAGSSRITATVNGGSQQIDALFVADTGTAQIVAGNLQVTSDGATANNIAANRVHLLVTDASGNPLGGQSVSLNANNGAKIVASAKTDEDGTLSLPVTSTVAGESLVTATINGSSQSVTVHFVYDKATARVIELSVTNDNAIANGTAANNVKVVVKDAYANRATGMPITLSAGNGATVTATAITDENGEYLAAITSQVAGASVFTAQTNGQSKSATVMFMPDTESAKIVAGSLVVTKDNAPADGKQNNRVQLKVTDARGNALANQTVTFAADNGAIIAASGTSDTEGSVTMNLTSTTAGISKVTATINGSTASVETTFVADANTATIKEGAMTVVTDNAITDGVATNSVKVVVTDAQGNPVPDAKVNFVADNEAVIAANGVTDESGSLITTVTSTHAGGGVSHITATLAGGAASQTVQVTFMADIQLSSFTLTGQPYVTPGQSSGALTAQVIDAYNGKPAKGIDITFSTNNGGSFVTNGSSSLVLATDPQGQVTVSGVKSSALGQVTVTATVGNMKKTLALNVVKLTVINKNNANTAIGDYYVWGRVVNAAGKIVSGVTVYASITSNATYQFKRPETDTAGNVGVGLFRKSSGPITISLSLKSDISEPAQMTFQ